MILLTVIIPSYNVSQYISKTLNSLIDVPSRNMIEILVINDGSTDSTEKVALSLQTMYPETVRVINKMNGGHGSTINAGIREARGKYFKVIDGDDWVDSKSFEGFLQGLQNTDADVVITPYTVVNTDDHTNFEVKNDNLIGIDAGDFDEFLNQISEIYFMHALTFKTEILKKNKKDISENCFYVDQEYIMYPLEFIKTFTYINENVYQYRIGRADQSMNWNKMVQNSQMHKRVLRNLIIDYKSICGAEIKKDFYKKRIAKLIRTQYLIFLHDHNPKDGYNKFTEFRLQKTDGIKGEGKVSKILEKNNLFFYPVRAAMKLHLIH